MYDVRFYYIDNRAHLECPCSYRCGHMWVGKWVVYLLFSLPTFSRLKEHSHKIDEGKKIGEGVTIILFKSCCSVQFRFL